MVIRRLLLGKLFLNSSFDVCCPSVRPAAIGWEDGRADGRDAEAVRLVIGGERE